MEVKSKWAAAVFIVMALVLALGMAVVAAPAGDEAKADVQQWSGLLTPNPISLGIMPGQDIVLMELSPNVATDNTIYAITVDPNLTAAGDFTLYTPDDIWQLRKSTNGGYWWETMGTGLGAGMPAGSWRAVDMAVAPDDPNYIVIAMTDGVAPQQTAPGWAPAGPPFTSIVYVSADGGATFSTLGALGLPATEAITSVDVSPIVSGVHQIVVGVQDTVTGLGNTAAEGVYVWGVGTPPSLTWTAQGFTPANIGVDATDVFAVAFSPNYYSDFSIVALSATVLAGVGDSWVHLRDTSDNVAPLWDDGVVFPGWPAAGAPLSDVTAFSPDESDIVQADIALPDDFDATRSGKRVIYAATASLPGLLPAGYADDAWRITAGTPWRLNVLGGTSVPISSLSHAGNISGGNLLAGGLGGVAFGFAFAPDIYTCTTPFSGTPMWMSSSKLPTGLVNTQVRAAPDYATSGVAYASVMGGGPFAFGAFFDESALSKCYDFGDTWNQIGLIDTDMTGGITDVAPVEATNVFMTSVCAVTGAASLWMSLPGGLLPMSLWERVDMTGLMVGGTPDVELSPDYATDNTVYWADAALGAGGGTLIRVSQDGGAYFATRNALTAISDYVVEDANTIYYVDAVTATVYRSSDTGHTWPTTGVLATAANIIEQEPVSGALAVSGAGIISTCLDTTAHPLTFMAIAIISPAGALQYMAFSNGYDSDGIVYVGDSGGGVFKISALGTEQIDLTVALANLVAAPSGIACTADGTLYVSDATANAGVWRTMNPTESPVIPGVEPQWVGLSWGLGVNATMGGVGIPATPVTGLETVSGSNVLFSLDTTNNMIPVPLVVGHTLVQFTDTLVTTVPTLVAPSDGTITGVVETTLPMQFVRVDFEWSPVSAVHQYRIQVDTDSMFHNPWINAVITAPDTTLISRGVLDPNTKFYWRVRVEQFITAAGASPWSAAWSFNTPAGEAVETAPVIQSPVNGQQSVGVEDPCFTWGSVASATEYNFTLKDSSGTALVDTTVTETSYCYTGELEYETSYVWTVQGTSATTESGVASASFSTEAESAATPVWVWIVIAIGAVVAIVVIVLIVRTRRPV